MGRRAVVLRENGFWDKEVGRKNRNKQRGLKLGVERQAGFDMFESNCIKVAKTEIFDF